MNSIEKQNAIFKTNTIDILLNIFWIFVSITVITYLFSYFIGNKLIYKNNRIRQQFEFDSYIRGVTIISLIISTFLLLSISLVYYDIHLIC